MIPVFFNVACAGIGPVTDFRFCVAFFAVATGAADAAAGAAVGVASEGAAGVPPGIGLRIIGLRTIGFNLIVETPAEEAGAAGVGAGVTGAEAAGAGATGAEAAPKGFAFGGIAPTSSGAIGVISASSAMYHLKSLPTIEINVIKRRVKVKRP